MAQSRIRLRQLDSEVFDYFDDLIIKHSGLLVKDLTRNYKIAFVPPNLNKCLEKVEELKELVPVNRFKVMDLDDKLKHLLLNHIY